MKRVPVALQSMRNECGLACLAMVVGYYDRHMNLTQLRRRFAGYEQGVTLKDLADFAQQLGYLCRGLRTEPADLRRVRRPAILHWNMEHFVVLVGVRKQGCLIHDPARGRMLCSWAEVNKQFTGVMLELWPGEDGVGKGAHGQGFGFADLWRLMLGSRAQLGWIMVLSLALQVMVLAAPWHVQWTVDEALMTGDAHLVGVLCFGFALLLVCRMFTHLLRGLLVLHLGHMLSYQLAYRLLDHLLRLPLGWFEHRHIGDVASRFASLQPLRDLLTQGAAAAAVDLLMVVLSLILMLVYSPMLALLVVTVHLSYLAVHLGFVPRLKRYGMGLVVNQAEEQSHLLESARAIYNVKVYTLEPHRLDQWQRLHARTLDQSLGLQRTQLGLGAGALLVSGGELIALIYFMAHQVLAGAFTLGMLFAFLSYRGQFTERLRGFADQLVNIRTLRVHLERVGDIWDETPEGGERGAQGGFKMIAESRADLVLAKVSYRYHGSQPWLLKNVDLRIAAGEFVAFIGASGCGKTTLLKLLMGVMAPGDGVVAWNNRPLHGEVALTFRQRSGCVLQTDSFFSGSVLDNIVLFDAPDLERVHACLSRVGLSETIAGAALGYHTQIGDIGHSLSSGQMQRLLMARALYRNPAYLFLDEGTANLDMVSAEMIHALIRSMDCTRIVVTHDLEFAACADRVLIVEDGTLRQVHLLEGQTGKAAAALKNTKVRSAE